MGAHVLGVGIIGAGPVTQAIHVPTLQRMPDRFRVTHVMDTVAETAEAVAARTGARHSTDIDTVLADPSVDVVAVCSPHAFHADQVVAACAAGKRAILCEKPLAMTPDEATAIAKASAAAAVPVLVGTMHAYDHAWRRALDAWESAGERPHTVRISALIPPNPGSEDFASEIVGRPPAPAPSERGTAADIRNVHGGVMGLAIHDLPLVRRLARGGSVDVLSARALAPSGYEIVAQTGDTLLEIHGSSSAPWDPSWTLDAISTTAALHVAFPLPYVHAGSAVARHATDAETVVHGPYPNTGYTVEWNELYDVATGAAPAPDTSTIVDDALFAQDIAAQAVALMERESVIA